MTFHLTDLVSVHIKSSVMSFLDNSAAIPVTPGLSQVTRSRNKVVTSTWSLCDAHLRILLSLYTEPVNRPVLASIKYLVTM